MSYYSVSSHLRPRTSKNGKTAWQIVIEFPPDPITKKRRRKHLTVTGTKKEAERKRQEIMYQYNHGGNTPITSSMKLTDWLNSWQEKYIDELSPTTKETYAGYIKKRIEPYFYNIPIDKVTTQIVQDWVLALSKEENLAPKTVKNIYNILSSAMKKAKKLKMITETPCQDIELPKTSKTEADFYTEKEVKVLLKAIENTDFELLIPFEIITGLRRGEALALRWDNVDLQKGVIYVKENMVRANGDVIIKAPKSNKGLRSIFLGKEMTDLLIKEYSKYIDNKDNPNYIDFGYVFCKANGEPYKPDSVTRKWHRFLVANKLRIIRFHDLRHTSASLMIRKGLSMKVVQARLGHADIQTTMNTYAHCLPSMNQEAGDKLDSILF